MERPLGMYIAGSIIKLEINSIPEFQQLLEQAEKEACQLHETLSKLRGYTIDIQLDVKEETISSQ